MFWWVLSKICTAFPLTFVMMNTRDGSSILQIIPEPTARSAVPGVSPGRGLLIPHGYLHPGKCEHSEVTAGKFAAAVQK